MIKSVLVLGGGSAGLMAALALKLKLPQLKVQVVRDPVLGVIGVGESTTPNIVPFLFQYLRISPRHFYAVANPTWKLGIHFLWGPRKNFEYTFTYQLDGQWSDLPMPNGFYYEDDLVNGNEIGALMAQGKAFRRTAAGAPDFGQEHAFHIYNPDYVRALEMVGTQYGIEYIDGVMSGVERGPAGLTAIVLQDGRKMPADLFVDASGFRSELLGKALAEPYVSFASSLYCDRAVVGSWDRTTEPILPYTTAETMDAGWCWQIEHEKQINRGYVYCSSAISDEMALAEFQRKNPKARTTGHVIKFKSGRYARGWVENVVALGNAGGFVEPLEATALMLTCAHCTTLVDVLMASNLSPTPTIRQLYNSLFAAGWDEIRNFLAIHYRFNNRLDTPFWRHCQADVDVSAVAGLLEFYRENGPTRMCRYLVGNRGREFGVHSAFGLEGYLTVLMGCKVPFKQSYQPSAQEWQKWRHHQAQHAQTAAQALTAAEAQAYIRHPDWRWSSELPTMQK